MSYKNVVQNLSLGRSLKDVELMDGQSNMIASVTADRDSNVLFVINFDIIGVRSPTFDCILTEDGVEIPYSDILSSNEAGALQSTFSVIAQKGKVYVYSITMDSSGNDEVIENGYITWNYF